MSAHTPGPWVVDCANHNLVARDVRPYEYICEVAPSEFSESTHDFEQECANARLIAAAPLMLHELYAAAAQIEALGGDASTQRAAIAKATGKA